MGKVLSAAVPLGVILFAIGVVAVAALFVTPAFASGAHAPTWVYLCTMCAPVGLVVALLAAVLGGTRR